MVHALTTVAFCQLVLHKPPHHDADPLLPDNGVLNGLGSIIVGGVDANVAWRYRWLERFEGVGLGCRHCGGCSRCDGWKDVARGVVQDGSARAIGREVVVMFDVDVNTGSVVMMMVLYGLGKSLM